MSWQQPEEQQPQGQGWGAPQQPQQGSWDAPTQQQPQAPYGGPQQQAGPFGGPQQPQPPYGAPQQPYGAPQQGQVPQFGAPQQPGQTPPPFYTPHPYEKNRSGFRRRQIISVVVIVLVIGGFIAYQVAHNSSAQRNSNGAITKSGTVDVTSLQVGDCFNGGSVGATDLSSVTGVPCTQAHSGQVLSSVQMTDTSYPSSTALDNEAQSDCKSVWDALPSTLPSDANGAYLAPSSSDDFNQGDTTITCLLQSTSQDLTASYVSGSN
jgi:hypothetical protein